MYNSLAPNHKRAKTVIISFYVVIGISIITLLSKVSQIYTLQNIAHEIGDDNSVLQTILDLAEDIIYLTNIVVFIMWFRRAYHNLEKIRVFTQYSEGWAAGFWFVPFLNLVRPYQIMKEIWEKTQEATPGIIHFENTSLVATWWAFYLVNNFTGLIIAPLILMDLGMDASILSIISSVIPWLINTVAAIITVLMVKKMSVMESSLYSGIGRQQENGEDLLGYVA